LPALCFTAAVISSRLAAVSSSDLVGAGGEGRCRLGQGHGHAPHVLESVLDRLERGVELRRHAPDLVFGIHQRALREVAVRHLAEHVAEGLGAARHAAGDHRGAERAHHHDEGAEHGQHELPVRDGCRRSRLLLFLLRGGQADEAVDGLAVLAVGGVHVREGLVDRL